MSIFGLCVRFYSTGFKLSFISFSFKFASLLYYRLQSLIFVGTWNVNAKGIKDETLDDWLCKDWGGDGRFAPDIVCVGFQEIVDLNAVNVAVDNKTQQKSQYWADQLRQTLNAPHLRQQYTLIMQRSLVGLLVCLFVKEPHRHRCKAVTSDSVGVGVMGMMGNKGGVAVRLQFYDSTICFVCAHLAAHRENVAGRNADYFNVLQKVSFDIGEDAVRDNIRNGSMSQWASGSATVGVGDHDITFWLGDLNYRIDESLPTEKVLDLAVNGQIDQLRPLDQLNIERREGRSFQGFEEGHINFVPSYKYQPGTDIFDQRPEKKLRAPAWCDRILWMAQEPRHVQQMTYNRAERPNCSDHKPVYSTFHVTIKDVMVERRESIYKELVALLDRFENQSLPMVGLDRVKLDFGQVKYDQSVSLPITVTNTGNVCAQFRFVPKLDEVCLSMLFPPWMYGYC
jgi:inositol polyphosphate 5-phosphatase INPP5B/F